jgi:hypothetical protein
MKKFLIVFVWALVISNHSSSQTFSDADDRSVPPHPAITWDSLLAKIPYPEIWRRADLCSLFLTQTSFDSLGNILEFQVTGAVAFNHTVVYSPYEMGDTTSMIFPIAKQIEEAFRSVKWVAASCNQTPIPYALKQPILFMLSNEQFPKILIKNIPKPIIKRDY